MREIVDRGILFLCSIFLLIEWNMSTEHVLVVLCSLIAVSLGYYFDNLKWKAAILILYMISVLIWKDMAMMFPALLYECCGIMRALYKRENAKAYSYYIPAVITGIFCLVILNQCFYISGIDKVITMILLSLLTVWLYMSSENYGTLKQKYVIQRDSSVELNMELKNKNKYLVEKQDYEVYLATLRERNRIAREIHDNVGHMLSRSLLMVGALRAVNRDEQISPQIELIRDTLDQAMTSIRNSVHDLHDDSVDLQESVHEMIRSMDGYQVDFIYDVTGNIPKDIKYCMISVVKEAISNVIKHSNGNKVSIKLVEHPAFFNLTITDNGRIEGKTKVMERDLTGTGGIGLTNIKSRVEGLKGTFSIHTDRGFRIFIMIPKG